MPIRCTNPTLRIGADPVPSGDGRSSTSPEISTCAPANGTSALLSAERRYVELADFFAESEVPVPGGTRITLSAWVRTNVELVSVFNSCAATDARPSGAADRRQPVRVIRSARLGGSGCGVPGVGFPVRRPVPCADTPAVTGPLHHCRVLRFRGRRITLISGSLASARIRDSKPSSAGRAPVERTFLFR